VLSDVSLPRLKPGVVGIACVIGAVLTFTTQDMAIKWLSGGYPLHQIILVRALIALLFTLCIFVPLEGGIGILKTRRLKLHLLRGLAVVIANMTFFTGLASLPLSEATAVFYVAPLLITAFSVPFLGERVGWRRWLAVVVGLLGVLLVVRPGSATFSLVAMFPLAAAVAYALLQIMTRKLGMAERAATMAFYIQVTFILVSASVGVLLGDGRLSGQVPASFEFLVRPWIWPEQNDLVIMVTVGVLSGVGGYLISQAYRMAEAGVLAPFEYVALPLALFWGFAIFGEVPDVVAWLGIALIAFAGVYTFLREMTQRRANALERPMPRNR